MILEEKTMSSEKIYNGKVINLRVDTVELPQHKYQKREIVEHPGAVAILALTEKKEVILVKQFRKPVEETLLELPAGKLELGEDPKECAIRELKEETGYEAEKIKFSNLFYTSAGFSNEKMYLYLATGLKEGQSCPDEDEYIEVFKVKISEALDMIKKGEIKDAKTIIGILLSKDLI
ncbi:NUDIX hydrolase [Tepidibacter formicigenes]|jgi:ADP-ribose pyrophosphatase|uniref:ADP-ribose pyrophosphatase n=1 Tax=Tepidibacter formicigenes DSM 15518 TaxID=1123349 RepID=A0A1M6L1B6_9FIRM|nr:NUDIX hydrolase [Tepidibacter formicigenes]SHJ64902.1 ADP-ribose pyrophosphatase [Tepidibacter formicigenes DSM 15518]